MDNTVYGMPELSHTDSDTPPQQHTASPYSLPVQYKGNSVTQTLPLHTEGDYDLVAPQNKPLDDDAMYSQLEHDNTKILNKSHTYHRTETSPPQESDNQESAAYSLIEYEDINMSSKLK